MPARSLDFGKALVYMFEEPDWMKKFFIGVGLVLSIFPLALLGGLPALVPSFILTGYSMEISRRTARGEARVLPEWNAWGKYFRDGATLAAAALIYALPVIVPILGLSLMLVIFSSAANGELSGPMVLLVFAFACATMLYIIPMLVFLYGGLVEYLRTDQFRSFFSFRKLSALRSERDGNPRRNFALVLFMILIPLGLAGSALPILGTMWAFMAQGHLIGQILQQTGYELPASSTPGMVTAV